MGGLIAARTSVDQIDDLDQIENLDAATEASLRYAQAVAEHEAQCGASTSRSSPVRR